MTVLRTLAATVAVAAVALGAGARPFTPEDLVQTARLSGPVAISPNGASVAYIQTQYSIEAKRQSTRLVVQPLLPGGEPVLVAEHLADPPSAKAGGGGGGKNRIQASQPVWLGDDTLAFVSTDPETHTSTLFSVRSSRRRGWSKPHAVLKTAVPIADVQFSAASGVLAFTAEVYNGTTTLEETAELDRQDRERADSGRVYEELWVRHWDTFASPKLPQIHAVHLARKHDGSLRPKQAARNIIRDTVAGGRLEAAASFVFSPDGRQVAFVAKKPGADYAWRTTSYVYLASVDGTAATPINANDKGASSSPAFSADGSRIAYLQMAAPAYEADRNQIWLYDAASGSAAPVAADWDRSPAQIEWADADTLLATYDDWGRRKLARVDVRTGAVTPIVESHSVGTVQRVPGTAKLLVDYSGFDLPTDLFLVSADSGALEQVTRLNPRLGEEVFLSAPEDLEFAGAGDATIHGFLLHPPGFDPEKTYPLAFVIHGGPQSSFADAWSSRWNLNVLAAAGFVTVAMDVQGSTGYGQNFTDAIRNQWGGLPYDSLMMSLEQLLATRPYIDGNRLAALGASYGGYMINWINGHTDVFKALVNHDGMFSTVSTYYSTEELYFPETEFEGAPFAPEARKNYERWSPERFVHNWRTPTLVIHGERDYRLVVSEGLSTFTALRRQGVPAKLLYFPDENHWVLKPANSLRWHREVLDWISRWTPASADAGLPVQPAARFRVQGDQ
ncbi:dipeptidylpeptidase [Coemansia nantahalensis]|uniref:Dipeptidylpeptidase n=1 Tax=Coemansia nantahalensis TaxID=2789366 RepID=A0ACC1K8E5_9FUNG|nr:dipeptidylpeptidase [Coemansia nantahalensis]